MSMNLVKLPGLMFSRRLTCQASKSDRCFEECHIISEVFFRACKTKNKKKVENSD